MLHRVLNTRRPDTNHEQLEDYQALYSGGDAFRRRLTRFIPQRPDEADRIYQHRLAIAHYVNYAGPIINYFAALTFSDELEVKAEPKAPAWYAERFLTSCDGLGMDLHVMLRDRFTRASVQRRSWVLVDFPAVGAPVDNRADWEAMGAGDAYLCPLDDGNVLDWECDERGELEWAIVHHRDERRRDPSQGRDVVTDTWTVWGRYEWVRYAVTYDRNRPPGPEDDIPEVARGPVATEGRVPLVRIELPEPLWVMNVLASPQIEQMRARNALSYSLQRTCYAMRIFKLADPDRPPVHGPGYGMVIGKDDDVTWDAPPGDAFAPVEAYASGLKDELYRVANQMALGVDNNAAAVGRSGDSKAQDHAATIIVVKALAAEVREAAKRILDLVALGRGEVLKWTVGGLDSYDVGDLGALAETAVTVETLSIPSVTFRREWAKKVALVALADATPETRDAIAREIDAGVVEEDMEEREEDEAEDEVEAEGDGEGEEPETETETEAD